MTSWVRWMDGSSSDKMIRLMLFSGHPKTKLFMSHGGLLSSQETTWHGVPTLIIPFFADQFTVSNDGGRWCTFNTN